MDFRRHGNPPRARERLAENAGARPDAPARKVK
jgi:hypothetical protein